ncbi:hypothetical protein VF21_09284 [Pseudogymnoascus sp. 05NY08]|nr:hypothetical protein VF21_09284 [Pseudogymnoascus sp. 05NY08]
MDDIDEVMQYFGREYNTVLALYNEDDKEEECINAAQNLLEDPDLPRYLRILTLIILGTSIDDWDDSETCRLEAKRLWEQAHRQYAALDIPDAFRPFDKLRVQLDAFDKMQKERLEMLENLDNEYEVNNEEQEDGEEDEKEKKREADVGSEVDVDADAGATVDAAANAAPKVAASAAAISDAVYNAESGGSLGNIKKNATVVTAHEPAMNESELPTGTSEEGAEGAEGAEGKKASATVRIIKIKDTILDHQLILIEPTPKQIDRELARKVVWPIVPALPLSVAALQVVNNNV